ncbi:helix-turn-helix domain-containing protein [Mucilaginibacter polytrichastri]|uniref:HTH araC/xylS-type domain-containing protein n=1 Tax=Mucilaginibacter polytrichastri TaxID=1302689 RepID=A0A1Q5ZW81_9SPHI|nr:AraC family transcriptional regulator [Mucilaginibacter polytrichastri]OKS86034.1 hypothetical protein RG47T_1481 [Mucilaginibacter polytrichastri]SFS59497.1 AraC-type DNA-binding protein [Mucilaginibacter polytrichastri]
MKQTLSIHLAPEVEKQIKPIKKRPDYCEYHVPYAACELIPLPDAPIIRQQSRNNDYYMQLLDINASRDIKIRFSVTEPTFFGIFMLKGECTFHDNNSLQISRALEKTYYFCQNGIVTYDAWVKEGLNTILVVAYRAAWVIAERNNLPKFDRLINNLFAGSTEPVILPPCHLGSTIVRFLGRILYYTDVTSTERGSGIFHLLVKCMMHYHGELVKGHHLPGHDQQSEEERLKSYVSRYYMNELMTRRETIAAELGLSEWTIKQLAMKLFGKSIYQQFIDLRMNKATALLTGTDMSVRDIAFTLGYDNEAYFSKAFSQIHTLTPTAYRKKHKA